VEVSYTKLSSAMPLLYRTAPITEIGWQTNSYLLPSTYTEGRSVETSGMPPGLRTLTCIASIADLLRTIVYFVADILQGNC